MHRRVEEGSGEGSAGCVVHVDVHCECVVPTEHGRYSLTCMHKL